MRPRSSHAVRQTATPRGALIVTVEGAAVRASLICSDPADRRRLEPLIWLVQTVVDAALERGMAGAA